MQDESLLGNTVSGDSTDPPSTPLYGAMRALLAFDWMWAPEVMVEDDGDVGLDWGTASDCVLSVSVRPRDGHLSWACLVQTPSERIVRNGSCEMAPDAALEAAMRVWVAEHDRRIGVDGGQPAQPGTDMPVNSQSSSSLRAERVVEEARRLLSEITEEFAAYDRLVAHTHGFAVASSECSQCVAEHKLRPTVLLYQRIQPMLRALLASQEVAPSAQWQDIATAPDGEAWWWVVPKTAEETYTDTSGNPILARGEGLRHFGKRGTWSSLYKAVLWYPAPPPPAQEGSKR